MSWIFGYYGNRNRIKLSSPETPLHTFQNLNLIFYAGGNYETIFFKSDPPISFLSVAGVGLIESDEEYKILNLSGWDNFLSPRQIDLRKVNGHFVAVKYSDDELNFFTDELGLREIYIVKLPDGFGFTTRIDWLKYFINPDLDLREFGTRWLLQNQVSLNSIIKNVNRLVCSAASLKNGNLTIKENHWKPGIDQITSSDLFHKTLKKLLSINGRKISLSLSGGLDSRLLLSCLVNKNSDVWETHTFGDPNHPDSKIAVKLLSSLNLKNKIIDEVSPANDELIELTKTYAVQSAVTNPVSSILNLRFYESLAKQNKIIIDGGFGEIWRREFANKLLIVGRMALLQKDAKRIFGLLKHKKANIFSDEVLKEMEKGAINRIEKLFEVLPDAAKVGSANWIDIFSIRERLTNYYAPEQARIDRYVLSFMPLVQKDVLKMLFGFNNSDKKNGKLFKELIRQNSTQLTKHPLVKGNIIHPFNSSSISARLQSRAKNRLGLSYQSKQLIEFQNLLKEFIGDVIKSSEVRNYEYYDRKKLNRIADDFLLKENNFNSEVDWFLSFELFRQGISK